MMEMRGDAVKTEEGMEEMESEHDQDHYEDGDHHDSDQEVEYDEQTWLSLENAEMICEDIEKDLSSLDPENKEALQISRFLAAINGLMGDKHDDMVADDMENRQSYDAPLALDSDIRQRLELLISRFPL